MVDKHLKSLAIKIWQTYAAAAAAATAATAAAAAAAAAAAEQGATGRRRPDVRGPRRRPVRCPFVSPAANAFKVLAHLGVFATAGEIQRSAYVGVTNHLQVHICLPEYLTWKGDGRHTCQRVSKSSFGWVSAMLDEQLGSLQPVVESGAVEGSDPTTSTTTRTGKKNTIENGWGFCPISSLLLFHMPLDVETSLNQYLHDLHSPQLGRQVQRRFSVLPIVPATQLSLALGGLSNLADGQQVEVHEDNVLSESLVQRNILFLLTHGYSWVWRHCSPCTSQLNVRRSLRGLSPWAVAKRYWVNMATLGIKVINKGCI